MLRIARYRALLAFALLVLFSGHDLRLRYRLDHHAFRKR